VAAVALGGAVRRLVQIIFVLVTWCALSARAEYYLCTTEASTGLAYDEATKAWRPATFRKADKYIFRKSSTAQSGWEVVRDGFESPLFPCDNDFDPKQILQCRGVPQYFLNRKTLRFMRVYWMGYWSDDLAAGGAASAQGRDTPSIEIGTCVVK
jgi:hypothetical protein